MKPNNEDDSCAMCGLDKGEVPISDEHYTYWICEYCDSEMFDNSIESKGLEPRVEITANITGIKSEVKNELLRQKT